MRATVTKENQENATEFFHKTVKDSRKNPLRVRRNGQTKTWKRKPDFFMIPVKYGLRDCFYIDNLNCKEWEVEI
jgi:hypothetical protein